MFQLNVRFGQRTLQPRLSRLEELSSSWIEELTQVRTYESNQADERLLTSRGAAACN